jgi:hypothetical protein
MPMQWTPPMRFIEIDGERAVYHVYKDQDIELPREYWYTTDEMEDPAWEFDIRELSQYNRYISHEFIIRRAVQEDDLKFPSDAQIREDTGDALERLE